MFKAKYIFIFSLLSALSAVNIYASSKSFALKMGYETSYAKALKKAKEQNKPLMMVISGKTCPWCKKFERQTLKKNIVNEIISKEFIPLTLTRKLDKYPKKFDVKVIPTVFFIDPKNENAFEKSLGYKNKKDYKKVLTKVIQKYKK